MNNTPSSGGFSGGRGPEQGPRGPFSQPDKGGAQPLGGGPDRPAARRGDSPFIGGPPDQTPYSIPPVRSPKGEGTQPGDLHAKAADGSPQDPAERRPSPRPRKPEGDDRTTEPIVPHETNQPPRGRHAADSQSSEPSESIEADAPVFLPRAHERGEGINPLDLEGTRLVGKYDIGGPLGFGGHGAVMEATDTQGRPVALKVITHNIERATDAGVMREVHHPHNVPVWDSGLAAAQTTQGEGQLIRYVAMPHFNGGDLLGYMLKSAAAAGITISDEDARAGRIPPLPPGVVAGIINHVAQGLDYAHSKGIIHRDIKPGNVLLHEDRPIPGQTGDRVYRAAVTDFGIATRASDETTTSTTSQTGPKGTLPFMAQEVLDGNPATRASDLYATGVLAYFLTAGSLPYEGNRAEMIERQRAGIPAFDQAVPQGFQTDERNALWVPIGRAIDSRPRRRPETVGEFSAELTASLKQVNPNAQPSIPVPEGTAYRDTTEGWPDVLVQPPYPEKRRPSPREEDVTRVMPRLSRSDRDPEGPTQEIPRPDQPPRRRPRPDAHPEGDE